MHFISPKVPVSAILISLFYHISWAQNSPDKREYISNHLIWTSLTFQGPIKNKFSYQFDFEYRRQADPMHAADTTVTAGNNHYNLFKNNYQTILRPWLQYQLGKTISFALSPIAWSGTWTPPANDIVYFQPELRTSFQAVLNNKIGRVQISHRYRYELRYFGTKEIPAHSSTFFGPATSYDFQKENRQGRFRYMLRFTIPVNTNTIETKTYYTTLYAEILLKTGKYINNSNLIDQYRFFAGGGYKFSSQMRLELGYFNAVVFRLNNASKNNVDVNNTIWAKLIIENFNKIFKKGKEKVRQNEKA